MKRNMYGATNTNYKSLILAISLFFALSASISAAPGDLDPTFGNGGKRTDWAGYARGVAIQPDGKIVVVGTDSPNYPIPLATDFRVARYNPDGTPDTTFGGGTGRVTTDFNGNYDNSWSVVIQPDGKIIVAGVSQKSSAWYDSGLALARYNPDGSLDTTFAGGSGKILTLISGWYGLFWTAADVAVQPDGKILAVAGNQDGDDNSERDGVLIRYNADGSLDTSFGAGGSLSTVDCLASVAVQPADGKIVANQCGRIARFNANGSPDTGFGSGGMATSPEGFSVSAIAIQFDGKIVAAGYTYIGSSQFALVRLNLDGSPDSSFDGDGIVTTPSLQSANSVVIQSDGKIVAAGYGHGSGNYDVALARYNSNGSLDNTFGGGDGITTVDFNNSDDFGIEVVLDNQGRAVVVGGSHPAAGRPFVFAIARFLGDSAPTCPNPIDCADFFVRQHYRDFLNREPDAAGLEYWSSKIIACDGAASCIDNERVNVSAAFFLSIEFQETGYLVYRTYKAAYGNLSGAPVPIRLNEFLPDTQQIGQGVIVGTSGWEQLLNNNQQNFFTGFVQRSRFSTAFPTSLTPDQFVDQLFVNAGVAPSGNDRVSAINEFGAAANTADTAARARALRRIAENATLAQQEFNRAFVLMQYFGYLRRNPNDAPDANFDGYYFWLNKLDQFNGNYINAQMVKAFIDSIEYRQRFGP